MSTKKDKFSLKEKKFMRVAINLAKARQGLTGENPSVGCVLVKNDRIISIGQTGYGGRPHAETNAINSSLENLNGAKMYVTLEPCFHSDSSPSCAKEILKTPLKNIVLGDIDLDSRTSGKSIELLKENNINVRIEENANLFVNPHYKNQKLY